MPPVNTVRIIGSILSPSGVGVEGGTITVMLSAVGAVESDGETCLIAKLWSYEIGADGTVDFRLVGNDLITPANTYYTFTYAPEGQIPWEERIRVYDGVSAIDIGDLERLDTPTTVEGVFRFPFLPIASFPVASEAYWGVAWRTVTEDGEYVTKECQRSIGGTWEWNIISSGGP